MDELTGAKKQYANIIKIDDLVRRGTYPSVERLAEVAGVSQRQVLRILKDMREIYHAPLQYDRQRKGYCYLLDGYSVADISLDEDESLALQVCSDFIAKVFGGTRLFARLHRGITSLLQRAELYDQEEGRVLADRIQLATGVNSMQFRLSRRQEDFEDILFRSLKEGQLLNVSFVDREGQLQREVCLPLMLVMHEDFAWLLISIKAATFAEDFTTVSLQEESFCVRNFSAVTAVSPYKDGHARPVTIGNDCWLGAGVIVCPGVTIGDNTVVGAGSVVTKDLPSNVVAVGNPCRVMREICEEDRIYYRKGQKIEE